MNRRLKDLQVQINREQSAGSAAPAPAVRSWACMKLGVEGTIRLEEEKRGSVQRWNALYEKDDWKKPESSRDVKYQSEAIVFLQELVAIGITLRQAAQYVREFRSTDYGIVLDLNAGSFSGLMAARAKLKGAGEKLETAGKEGSGPRARAAQREMESARAEINGMKADEAMLETLTHMLLNSLFREEFAEHEVYAIQKFAERNAGLLNKANIYLAADTRGIASFEGIAMLAKILEKHVLTPEAKISVAAQFCEYAKGELGKGVKISGTETWMFGQFETALEKGHLDLAGDDSGIRLTVFIMAALRIIELKNKPFEGLFLK
ncbi:Uncharacterised protein [Candidatus Anstonella stagnisolia]|nr:Uncharacterised protein [Candidatus Anstonella stagnisolia]